MKKFTKFILLPIGSALICQAAYSAGYGLKEVSANLLGSAFSNASTSTQDIAAMHFNPAIIGNFSEHQISTTGSLILGSTKAKNGTLTTPIPGTTNTSNSGIMDPALVPAIFYAQEVNDKISIGLALTAPYGLKTKYDNNWIGSYHAIRSELMSVNINPIVSYRLGEQLIIAAGLQAQYLDAKISNRLFTPGPTAEQSELNGDGWGWGGSLGLIYNYTKQTTFGIGYQSSVDTDLKGDVEFTITTALNTTATANVETPHKVNIGVSHEFNDQWTASADAQWTSWSKFKELRAKFDNALPDSVTNESWDDAWFIAAGINYHHDDEFSTRIGIAFDESPIPEATRTPRIPGNDRIWTSIGLTYNLCKNFKIDAGYTHLFVNDPKVNLTDATKGGTLTSDYESSINILAVGFNWIF